MTIAATIAALEALGLPVVAAAISVLGWLIARWQLRIAREKLRHDLYDRRFGIYMAFHNLLVAVVEKKDVEAELREANAARAHSPFLLDEQLGAYLVKLHKEGFRINATSKLCSDPSCFASPAERAAEAAKLGTDKLQFCNGIDDLVKEFSRFLRLKDFGHESGLP